MESTKGEKEEISFFLRVWLLRETGAHERLESAYTFVGNLFSSVIRIREGQIRVGGENSWRNLQEG